MAVDMFLKIEGIEGESHDSKHKNEIDVESWSWGESQSGSHAAGGGGGAGKVSMQDFNFTMRVNKASPKLMLACATGQHIKKATLTCRKAGGTQLEYLQVTMEELLISSYQTGGSGGSELPMEQISMNFAKIKLEYTEQKPDGTAAGKVPAAYDLKLNKAA